MDLLQLQYFCSAAELENFTLAAKRHLIPQSAMSITIKRLERELDVLLFDRKGNKVRLNAQGRKFYTHAKKCIEEFERAKGSVAGENAVSSELRLLVLEERKIIAEVITRFHRLYPNIHLIICHNLFEKPSTPFDIVVTSQPSTQPGWASQRLLAENLMIAMPNSHRLAREACVAVADLRDESFIMMPAENSLFRMTEKLCREEGFIPRKSILCDDPFCVRKYISAGLGISLIPPASWANLWEENIVLKPIVGQSVVRTTYLECRRADLEKPHIRLFFDFCLETVVEMQNQ